MAETIYQAYPRKIGHKDALRAIEKALKSVNPQLLLEKVQAFAKATSAWPPGDEQWIPHPASWFNKGRWEDDPKTWDRGTSAGEAFTPPTLEDWLEKAHEYAIETRPIRSNHDYIWPSSAARAEYNRLEATGWKTKNWEAQMKSACDQWNAREKTFSERNSR